jgi:hypothetical protein
MLKLRSLITEGEDGPEVLVGKDLATTVSLLKKLGGDKDFVDALNKGVEDGDIKDEQATISAGTVSCTDMKPTQAEIGFDNSLKDLCYDRFGAIDAAFKSPAIMPSPADEDPPVLCARVGGDVMILDGHHRWSLCYMINRNAKMQCDIIETEGGENAEDILKTMQIAITAKGEKAPVTKDFKGKNLMTTGTKEVVEYVKANLGGDYEDEKGPSDTKDEVGLFKKYTQGALDTPEKIAAEVGLAHTEIIKKVGENPRTDMPQAGETSDQDTVNKALANGEVDYMEPFADGYSIKSNATNQLMKEHFQKIANIK